MNTPKKSVLAVTILGKEYKIGCIPELQDSLKRSAKYLDNKMRDIRDLHQIVGLDKVAVLAALHIAHELLNNSAPTIDDHQVNEKLKELNARVAATIESCDI